MHELAASRRAWLCGVTICVIVRRDDMRDCAAGRRTSYYDALWVGRGCKRMTAPSLIGAGVFFSFSLVVSFLSTIFADKDLRLLNGLSNFTQCVE